MCFKEVPCICLIVILMLCPAAYSMRERPPDTPPPASILGSTIPNAPMILTSGRDTTWVQVHTDSTYCPGDPAWRRGGEATGGPGPLETWCFEGGDSCGTNPPWDTKCFKHVDVRAQPSNMGINFWHIDSYKTDQRAYCGDHALWCGSDSLWTDGYPVECGTWAQGKYPGYGNQWNCVAQLTLPATFDVANGCTLFFDPRYDTECKYDYFYVDFFNGTKWTTLATFNAASNNPGGECGLPSGGNPDYWGNTDTGQPGSADWQERANPAEPAFHRVITPDTLIITTAPMFRWRFTSDGAWSDADGRGNTSGAAFVDNVWVRGDDEQFSEDFESGVLDTDYWSLPDPDGVIDQWHMVEGAGQVYSGTCINDSSYSFRGRPESGYPTGASWRNGWYYRLMSPAVEIQSSGCVVQYDMLSCTLDYTCDYADTKFRFYNAEYGKWCPWTMIDGLIIYYCSIFWSFDNNENLSQFYRPEADSIQFAWDLMDVSQPGDWCRGKHKQTDMLVDNVSIGFFDVDATVFSARYMDLFQDSFHESICTYNSLFEPYSVDTLDHYSVRGGAPEIRKFDQLFVNVSDQDALASVELWGSIDGGSVWKSKAMTFYEANNPNKPENGGDFYANFCPADFAGGAGVEAVGSSWFWEKGIELWYYVKAEDDSGNVEYWPAKADPGHPGHKGTREDFLPSHTMSILPAYPDDYTGVKILLVDGYPRWNLDFTECMAASDNRVDRLVEIYERTLTDAGYCYDVYNISGGGSSAHIHPLQYTDYDCVFWFTGPYFSNYTVDEEAQYAIRDYMAAGGKVVFCGDKLAYSMWTEGSNEDSLGGEFLAGILGTDYLQDVESPFDKPYLYAAAVETLSIFGTPTAIDLDSVAIYRECPFLREMSYIQTIASPPAGYTAQPLMYLTNASIGSADEVIYVEYLGAGQCVFVDFDLSGSVTHERSYCSGMAATPMPGFVSGTYDGRVDLVRAILEDVFGLPSNGGGQANVNEPAADHRWALHQNVPNPSVGATEIRYELARSAHVSITVYNTRGQVVQVLENEAMEPGSHSVTWGGRNAAGERVSSGVYFYRIEAGPFTATRKMLVLR